MTFDSYDKSIPVKAKLKAMEELLKKVEQNIEEKSLKMRINKLLAAFGNLDQIAEGIKNRVFKKADVEAVAKLRWQV